MLTREQLIEAQERIARERGTEIQPTEKALIRRFPSTFSTHNVWNISQVPDMAMFWLILLKLSKDNPKMVERIILKLFDAFGDSLDAFCRAGSSNRISAWGSARLLSLFAERFGLISQMQASDFNMGLALITGAEVAEELTSLVPWKSISPDIDFPQTVVLGSKFKTIRTEKPIVTKTGLSLPLRDIEE